MYHRFLLHSCVGGHLGGSQVLAANTGVLCIFLSYSLDCELFAIKLFVGQALRHRCRQQARGHTGKRKGWDELRVTLTYIHAEVK